MFLPYTENDEQFIQRAMAQGASIEEAQDLLHDHYSEMEMDMMEENNDD